MRLVQLKELDETRARLLADAEQERDLARQEAEDLLASAKREADQVRLASQQEANDLRTGAKRESEQLRAAADREVQEARRTLAVEKERLAKEAAEHHTQRHRRDPAARRGGRAAGDRRRGAGPAGHQAGDRPPPAGADRGRGDPGPGPPRGRADRRLGPHPGRLDHRHRQRRGRPRAGGRQGRGGADDQAPRRDRRPAGLAARRGRRLRRGRVLSTEAAGRDDGGRDDPRPTRRRARDLGTPGDPLARHSPVLHRLLRRARRAAGLLLGARCSRSAPYLVLIVVAMFLAAGLNPAVEFFIAAACKRPGRCSSSSSACWSRSPCSCWRSSRSSPTRSPRSPRTPPSWLDELQRNRQVQELDEQVRRHLADQGVRRQGRLRRQASSAACSGVGLAVLSALANTFIVVVLTLYFLSSLDETKGAIYRLAPRLPPRPGRQARRPGHPQRGRLRLRRVHRRVVRRHHVADLPVRRRPRRVRRGAGVRGRAARRDPDDRRHHRRGRGDRDRLRDRPEDRDRLRGLLRDLPAARELRASTRG